MRQQVVELAPKEPDFSPRELAARYADTKKHYVSEGEGDQRDFLWKDRPTNARRILKAHNLIASPAIVGVKAADEFRDKTTRPNELWQTDFTYLKVIGCSWCYLRTILDDYRRYVANRAYAAPRATIPFHPGGSARP